MDSTVRKIGRPILPILVVGILLLPATSVHVPRSHEPTPVLHSTVHSEVARATLPGRLADAGVRVEVRCPPSAADYCGLDNSLGAASLSPNASWLNLSSDLGSQGSAPTAKQVHDGSALSFDAKDGYFVFYSDDAASDFATHTWILNHGVWSEDRTLLQPPATWDPLMTYDAADGYVVLVVQDTGLTTGIVQTWSFSGGAWANRTDERAPGPAVRDGGSIAFDGGASDVLLFGGVSYPCEGSGNGSCHPYFNDTWTYRAGIWTNETNASHPQPRGRSGAAMAYDGPEDAVLLFGGDSPGWGGNGPPVDLDWWEFSHGGWVNLTNLSRPHPSAGASPALASIGSNSVPWLFGGSTTYYSVRAQNESWEYLNHTWINETPALHGGRPPPFLPVFFGYDPVDNFTLLLLDGYWAHSTYAIFEYSLGPSALLFYAASRSTIDLGQSFALQVTPVPSGLNLSFQAPPGCAPPSNGTLSCTPKAAGSFEVNVSAFGPSGLPTVVHISVTVHADPTITAFSGTPSTVTLGSPIELIASVANGSPPLTYSFSGLPPGCLSANASSIGCTPTATGSYTLHMTALDAAGLGANATAILVVNPRPSALSLMIQPSLLEVGSSVLLSLNLSGGTLPYSYRYSGLPPGCTSESAADWTCLPTETGTFLVAVIATDASNWSITGTASLTILAPLTLAGFTVSPRPATEVGLATSIAADASGGDPPYLYFLSGFPGPCSLGTVSSAACIPTIAGSYSVTLNVTDGLGAEVSSTLTVTVAPALSVASFDFTPASVETGQLATGTVSLAGGVAPYAYAFPSGGALPCIVSGSTFRCTPTAAGNLSSRVAVTDALGVSRVALGSLTVLSAPVITAFIVGPTPAAPGSLVEATLTLSGGKAPYSVSYTGLPPGCASENAVNLSCRPSANGVYTLEAIVTDALGGRATQNATLAVEPMLFGLPTTESLVLITGTLALVAVVATALLLHRRRRGAAGPD